MARNHSRGSVEPGASCDVNSSAGSEELTVEVDGETAQRLNEVAWSFGIGRRALLRRLCEKTVEQSRY